jgi:4a-hydroxytetrahydrobiopterin dehydratase
LFQWSQEIVVEELTQQKCEACRVGAPKVTADEIRQLSPRIPEWSLIEVDGIRRFWIVEHGK